MKIYCIILWLALALLGHSCVHEPFFGEEKGDIVSIDVTTRVLDGTQGITISSIRFFAFDGAGNATLKKSGSDITDIGGGTAGEGRYAISLPSGSYDFFVIVNEPANIASALDAVTKRSDLDAVKIQTSTPFLEANIPLMKHTPIKVRKNTSTANGEVSTDNGANWSAEFSVQLERLYAKTSLFIKKNTTNPADQLTIKKVELRNLPSYSYLIARNYDAETLGTRVMYDNGTGIQFTDNNTTDPGTEIVAAVSADAATSNVFPEYHLSIPGAADKAMHYFISAQYKEASGSVFDVVYTIPLRKNLAVENYNLDRNDHYEVTATVTKKGQIDAVQINYTVRDWEGRDLSVDIKKDPFLDVSNVEVNAYDAAVTRVYFYTNQPEAQVYVKDQLSVGTLEGNLIPVKDVFYELVGEAADAKRNFVYTVNPDTGLGEGYLDIVNLNTTQSGISKRIIYLKSGSLERAIVVNSIVSTEAAKQNTTPYVGTFHRNDEKGERIVTWHAEGDWSVEIMTAGVDADAAASASHLCMDRLVSPAYYSGGLYLSSPMGAEGANVTKEGALHGRGRIYFRVGWDSYSTSAKQRHAKLKVVYKETAMGPEKTVYLYCRQGEEPDRIVSTAVRFATFNVDAPEAFVSYPSMSGNLYQWNKTKSWPVMGNVNSYPSGYNTTYDGEQYICPPKYAYPNQAALSQMATSMTATTYQWGYYADGYFDRRAVDKETHIVTGASGEFASAGGLFHHPNTSVGIFLPTADWRDKTGALSAHGSKGSFGHYWSAVMDDADGNTIFSYDQQGESSAIALHLTKNSGVDHVNRLEYIHKASAMNVRCMRLEGNTFYFDANGGKNAPRTITVLPGTTVTFPAGSKPLDPVFGFDKWYENPDASGAAYSPGEQVAMTAKDKTWYANYKKIGFAYNGSVYLLGNELSGKKTWANAVSACESEGDGWMLPEIDLLVSIFKEDAGSFQPFISYWSSTVGTNASNAYCLNSAYTQTFIASEAKSSTQYVRCVKKIN